MLTASGSVLVSGASPKPMKTVNVKVLRAFLLKTEPQKVGATISMELGLARELASSNKVEILKDAPPVADEPKPQRAKKEPANAGQ